MSRGILTREFVLQTTRAIWFIGATLLQSTNLCVAADQSAAMPDASVRRVYSPDHHLVAFIRRTPKVHVDAGVGELEATEIWTSRPDGSDAKLLLRGRAGRTPQETLADLSEIHFSPDGKQLFFLSAAWATSGAVHVVQIDSGKEHFVCPGNSLEVIQKGKYSGYLMVTQHRYAMGGGSYNWLWLLTPEGKDVAPISMDDDTATETFRKIYVDTVAR